MKLILSILFLYLVAVCKADTEDRKTALFKYVEGKKVLAQLETDALVTIQYPVSNTNDSDSNSLLTSHDIVTTSVHLNDTAFEVVGTHTEKEIQMSIQWRKDPSMFKWTLTFENADGKVSLTDSVLGFTVDKSSPFEFWENATNYAQDIFVNFTSDRASWANTSSYACFSQQNISGTVSVNKTKLEDFKVQFSFENTQLAAFGADFDEDATHCKKDSARGDWKIHSKTENKTACARLQAAIQLEVYYETTQNGTYKAHNVTISPDAKDTQSDCNVTNGDEKLVLTWTRNHEMADWSFTLWFTNRSIFTSQSDGTAFTAYRFHLVGDISKDKKGFPDAKHGTIDYANNVNQTTGGGAVNVLGGGQGHCVKCSQYEFTYKNNVSTLLKVTFSDVKAQAFDLSDDWLTEETCSKDQDQGTSDLIPIIVGACLAALVVIVLIAYLIGRARARRTGYESV